MAPLQHTQHTGTEHVRAHRQTNDGDRHRERHTRTVAGLHGLLDRRPELRGVYAPADAFYESLPWTV